MRSMTGYGRIEKIIGDYNYTVEIKSLNGKYLNLKTSLSGIFSPLEIKLQNFLKENFQRGNLSVFVDIRFLKPENFVDVDLGLAKSYHTALNNIKEALNLHDDPNLSVMTKFREVIRIKVDEESLDVVWEGLEEVLKEVTSKVEDFQLSEGNTLKDVILGYVDEIEGLVNKIEPESQNIKKVYKEKIENTLEQLLSSNNNINEERLELEIALIAEKADISEEIDRLRSHIEKIRTLVNSNEPAKGQNLDFLSQEMHREFNTIASKSKVLDITNFSVEGRVLVNKIREQVQNVH